MKALEFEKRWLKTEYTVSILMNDESISCLGLSESTYHWILSFQTSGTHLRGYEESIVQMGFVAFCIRTPQTTFGQKKVSYRV